MFTSNKLWRTIATTLVYCVMTSFAGWCNAAAAEQLLFGDEKLTTKVNQRSFKKEKEDLEVYIDACTTKEEVTFDESERDTRLATEFKQIFKMAEAGAGLAPSCEPGKTRSVKRTYNLKFVRGQVKIKATTNDESKSEVINVITGPAEHWYLGIDLPVQNKKTLKYDTASKSLLPQGTGNQLYLSMNYFFGDDVFLADSQHELKRFSGKIFIAAQSKPMDSVGIGIGYRLPKIGVFDLNQFEIFAGRFWTKEDAILAGTPQLNSATAKNWKLGISYNLSESLGWVKVK